MNLYTLKNLYTACEYHDRSGQCQTPATQRLMTPRNQPAQAYCQLHADEMLGFYNRIVIGKLPIKETDNRYSKYKTDNFRSTYGQMVICCIECCLGPATVRIFGGANDPQYFMCAYHAKQKVKELNAAIDQRMPEYKVLEDERIDGNCEDILCGALATHFVINSDNGKRLYRMCEAHARLKAYNWNEIARTDASAL